MHRLFLPALAGMALCCAVTLSADPAADARHAIQAAYNASGAAAARKDAAGTLAHFTPDAVAVDTKGRSTTIAQQLFGTAAQPVRRPPEASPPGRPSRSSRWTAPAEATATVHEHSVLTLANPQTQQPVRLEVDDTARDLWVKNYQGLAAETLYRPDLHLNL